MGKIKSKDKDGKTYILSEREVNYLKILNLALQFSTLKDKAISGYLYYVCNQRFSYPDNVNLVFEIDLDSDKRELNVKEIPQDVIDKLSKQGQ